MNPLLALAALTAFPGQVVSVAVPDADGLAAAEVRFEGQQLSLARDESGFFGLLGVDLDVKPGNYEVVVTKQSNDGTSVSETVDLIVAPKSYPVTKLTVAPKYVELSDENFERQSNERKQIRAAYKTTAPEPYWQDDFIIPVEGAIEGSNFGHRRVFNEQPRAPHSGADLKAGVGTPIMTSNAGKVLLTGDFFFNGKSVFVDHGMGVLTMYLHLSEISVQEGDILERGDLVGLAGATGRVTGPHLHWGARVGGARVDPFTLPGIPAPPADQ